MRCHSRDSSQLITYTAAIRYSVQVESMRCQGGPCSSSTRCSSKDSSPMWSPTRQDLVISAYESAGCQKGPCSSFDNMQLQGLKPKVITSSSVRSYVSRSGKWKILVGLPDPPLRGMKLHQQVSEPGGGKAVSGMRPSPSLLESPA